MNRAPVKLGLESRAVARFVLSDFENEVGRFVKVFPRDYKRALAGRGEAIAVK